MEVLIVTGMSGSGKSTAVNALEDIGFFCIDNMPPQLIQKFSQICSGGDEIKRAAFVIDIRAGEMFSDLSATIDELKKSTVVKILFLNAADEIIKRRYKETRRLHPLFNAEGRDMDKAVRAERALLTPIMEISDYKIDTSMLNTAALKESVLKLFLDKTSDSMLIHFTSFGFKYGIPDDADLVFDVRFLPNPFYVPELKTKTGLDNEVSEFVMKSEIALELERRLLDLIGFLTPHYVAEGKSRLVIAFGCTGGKHRSVTFAERLKEYLSQDGYRVNVFHRDIKKL